MPEIGVNQRDLLNKILGGIERDRGSEAVHRRNDQGVSAAI